MSVEFIVRGGQPLRGKVLVRGSKNVASKLMIASLLTEEPCVIENVPLSTETEITKELCETIGSKVRLDGEHRCFIETREIKNSFVPELSRRNRIPILALGPLLHRNGVAEVPVLGGCPIGHRPINFHVEALSKMGVKIERRDKSYYATSSKIRGADIEFSYPSVGATENVLLTAVRADGNTRIKNAAVEPEVADLIGMLRQMGAEIDFDQDRRFIEIRGVSRLRGATYKVMPDRPEIVSFISAALATEGEIFIPDIKDAYLQPVLAKVKEVGGSFETGKGGIRFWGRRPYRAVNLETSPHPGFMTDWQQPFCVLLTQAQGKSIIHETVYEDRFGYAKDLNRMGANIDVRDECLGGIPCRFREQTFKHSAIIYGPTPLYGEKIAIGDIRAGMAHIVASLAAEGESIISGVEHIDRGYEKIDERLQALGAQIKRINS